MNTRQQRNKEWFKMLAKMEDDIKSGRIEVDHDNTATKILLDMRGSEHV